MSIFAGMCRSQAALFLEQITRALLARDGEASPRRQTAGQGKHLLAPEARKGTIFAEHLLAPKARRGTSGRGGGEQGSEARGKQGQGQ
eukprot:849826-Pyramimonas_sp.AAC.1